MINLALIGSGKWGQNYIKTAQSLNNICRIKYICAQSQSTLDSLSDEFIKVSEYRRLFEYEDIQGIIIATPGATHYEIAKEFLLQGYSLLIEKPMVTSYKDALELYDLWEQGKQKVLVGHTQLYNPAYQEVKKNIEKIGSIKSVSFEGLLSPKRDDMSVIWDWGSHPVSLSLDLIGEPVIGVSCISTNETANIELLFNDDIRALCKISWLGENKTRKLIVEGSKGKIIFDDTAETKKIQLIQQTKIEYPEYCLGQPLAGELKEFVLSLTHDTKIHSDIKLGVEVTKILDYCDQSAAQGGKLKID